MVGPLQAHVMSLNGKRGRNGAVFRESNPGSLGPVVKSLIMPL